MTKVIAITCPECGYTIFSRARHDCRSCLCGKVFIDGGFDYTRLGFPEEFGALKTFELEVEQTPMELYNDWNTRANKFGLIPPEDKENEIEA